jgi:signal transduction histidine kinase
VLAKEFTGDVGQATRRMQRTVESLLAFCRSVGEASSVEPFDTLHDFLNQAVNSLRGRAAERNAFLLLALDTPEISVQGRDEWPRIICN